MHTKTPHTPRTEAAWKAVEEWMHCVNTHDVDSLLLLFCENDNAFWGTFANKIRKTREEVRTYYDHFLDCESIECKIIENTPREMTTEIVSFTGIYSFDIVKKKGDPVEHTLARFTFTIRHDNIIGRWVFVEHHSSVMPENGY